MTAAELMQLLETMPPDARVWHVWDGEARTEVEHVWLARDGTVVTADNNQVLYSTESRSEDAPTSDQEPYWCTPEGKNGKEVTK
jgi:hypothetical protein